MAKTNAQAIGRTLSVSQKHGIEICSAIRKKGLGKAKLFLNRVIEQKDAIPFRRFTNIGHRPGKIGPGRYPLKACRAVLSLLESAEANAQMKGMSTNDLIVSKITSNKASSQWHYGRFHRRKMKRVHIEVVLTEKGSSKKKDTKEDVKKDVVQKEVKKTEDKKKEEKKIIVKTDKKPIPKEDKK
tara:strand:- start:161 stop:712 length:552 start_codon:yes stop_codon:yes gene_type:complete